MVLYLMLFNAPPLLVSGFLPRLTVLNFSYESWAHRKPLI